MRTRFTQVLVLIHLVSLSETTRAQVLDAPECVDRSQKAPLPSHLSCQIGPKNAKHLGTTLILKFANANELFRKLQKKYNIEGIPTEENPLIVSLMLGNDDTLYGFVGHFFPDSRLAGDDYGNTHSQQLSVTFPVSEDKSTFATVQFGGSLLTTPIETPPSEINELNAAFAQRYQQYFYIKSSDGVRSPMTTAEFRQRRRSETLSLGSFAYAVERESGEKVSPEQYEQARQTFLRDQNPKFFADTIPINFLEQNMIALALVHQNRDSPVYWSLRAQIMRETRNFSRRSPIGTTNVQKSWHKLMEFRGVSQYDYYSTEEADQWSSQIDMLIGANLAFSLAEKCKLRVSPELGLSLNSATEFTTSLGLHPELVKQFQKWALGLGAGADLTRGHGKWFLRPGLSLGIYRNRLKTQLMIGAPNKVLEQIHPEIAPYNKDLFGHLVLSFRL